MCRHLSPKAAFILRVIYAAAGILIGVVACLVFNIVFSNKAASYLGLTSSFLSIHCLVLFVYLYVKMEVHLVRPRVAVLCIFGIVGAVGQGVGLGSLVIFLGLGVIDSVNHRDIDLPRSYYVVCVWGFANFKWGLTAFLYALKTYRKVYESEFYRLREDINGEAEEDTGSQNSINDSEHS